MKRRYIFILISLLVIATTLIFLANSGDDTIRKYPYGKDTLEFFGDGTFQIYRGGGSGDPPILYTHQIEAPNSVIDNIVSYKIKKISYMWLVKIASLNWIQVPTRTSKRNGFPTLLPKIERYSIN
jgi:hypothetical protein